jgi:hypothetical protein
MDLIGRLYSKYLIWKDQRFLNKHGCENWKQYFHTFDPDINRNAYRVRAFYANYNYYHTFKDGAIAPFQDHTDWLNTYKEVQAWCDTNCKGKWRTDIHRVIPDPSPVHNGPDYFLNDITGWDFIFFAFMDDADYIWFVTRWG